MQLVTFLILPSALLSVHLLGFAANEHVPNDAVSRLVDWPAVLKMWMVVGCFGLASRWLDKAQHLCFNTIALDERTNWTSPIWVLRNRESLLLWLWCLSQPICLVASGWTQWTRSLSATVGSQAFNIAILLAPSVVLLVLIDAIRVSRTNRRLAMGKSTWVRLLECRREMIRAIANTWLLPLALPILIAGLVDVGTLTNIAGTRQGLFGMVVYTLTTSIIVTLLIPHLFTAIIGAGPVDPTIASVVDRSWRLGSKKVPCVLHWPTGCRMANAAVVGLFGFGRKLLLTDALLQRLSDRELSMVVLHELAHCTRFHAWLRMLPTLVAIAMLLVAMTFLSGIWLSVSCVIVLGLFVASLVGVCWWTEFDADRVAIELATRSKGEHQNEAVRSIYAQELSDALTKIYGSRNMRKSSWMHPCCSQRLAAIRLLA
jgi:Zn-dependent protease with chaperone function